jgi:hypothetical protein
MRTQGYVYVDKTTHVARLAEEGKYYLLARTRRFGKGLLVDTLAEAFAGRGGGLERGTAPPKWECSATGPGIWATTASGAWDRWGIDRCYVGSFDQTGDWPVAGKWQLLNHVGSLPGWEGVSGVEGR